MFSGGGTVVLTISLILFKIVHAQIGKSCTTPNGESAKCKSIYDCTILLDAVRSRNSEQIHFLRESQCGFQRNPLVCCGTRDNFVTSTTTENNPVNRTGRSRQTVRNNAIPDRSSCGFQETDKIFGGVQTSIEEFPWTALLEYSNTSGSKRFACGGAVISKRYVLTAAHCVTGEIVRKVGQLANVRLGEWDTTRQAECDTIAGIRICNNPSENFGIESSLVHPDYDPRSNNRYNDIALVRLNRRITYSDSIRPICLPLSNEASSVGDTLVVAGWGKTEYASQNPIKLKVELPIADRSQCLSKFKSARIALRDSQICAGGQQGRDSCTGDSGGPLMRTTKNDSTQWYMEGVVSFGANCGTEGWPGIYTKVSSYLDWIGENVSD